MAVLFSRYERHEGVNVKIRIRITFFLLLVVSSVALQACMQYEKPKIDMAWPLPPDEPKIKYVDTIRSTLDVGKKSGFAEAVFGDEQAVGLAKPYGIAVDKQGIIYVTDPGRVFVFDLKNKSYDFIGMDPGLGKLAFPIGISVSSDGRLFVTDIASDRVFVYRDKKYVAAIGQKGELDGPSGVALDERRGFVYVVDSKKHMVVEYSLKDYAKLKIIGSRGSGHGEFNYPTNIAVDADGNLYVVDTGNFRIEIFDPVGNYLRTIGKLGDVPGSLARPKGIAIDSEGHIYVVDTAFSNFQVFDRNGALLLFVGGPGDPPGKFWLPAGITIDGEDKIYVVDQYPGLFQIFQYLGGKGKKN